MYSLGVLLALIVVRYLTVRDQRPCCSASSGSLDILEASVNGGPWIINTTSTGGYTFNNWHQVVVSRISGTLTIYVDTVSRLSIASASSVMSNIVGSTYNTLGAMTSTGTYASYTGKMSIVRIYKGVGLTSSQVIQNYNANKGRYGLT